MDIRTSKSIFARLLAQENLKVHHAKVQTASFDTKSRTLTLPIWTDMDGDLYDLLCGHEVGHALHTPAKGWHDAICGEGGDITKADMIMKGFLNVLEDARIEKKIKAKYPGLRANFYRAYQGLYDRDFFQVKGKSVQEMLLIDRINLHFKLGSFLAVQFSDEEKKIVRRVENLETWEEVEALARELIGMCKKELEEKQQKIKKKLIIKAGVGEMADSMEEGEPIDLDDFDEIEFDDSDGEEIDDSRLTEEERELLDKRTVVCETDRAFREHELALLDNASRPYEYMTLPTINSDPYIVKYKTVMEQFDFLPSQLEYMTETYAAFRKKNDKVVNYLVKEFELRRNAEQLARAKVSKSGEIDVKKVFSYKYNEDLFRRITTVPNGKNHGLIMFYDMSGSMSQQMAGTIDQMIVLVEFCRKVNIPFEVYGFTNGTHPNPNYHVEDKSRDSKEVGEIVLRDSNFHLRQYFTDRMRPQEYKQQIANMLLLGRIWRRRASRWSRRDDYSDAIDMRIPDMEDLNGTPLNQSIMISIDIYNKFIERTKAEVVNIAFLTDGDTDDRICYNTGDYYDNWRKETYMRTALMTEPDRHNVVITHKETRKSVMLNVHDRRGTQGLVKLVREVTGANVVCFDIISGSGRRVIGHKLFQGLRNWESKHFAEAEAAMKKFKKDRIYVIDNLGFNEYYLIPGGAEMDIDDDEIEVEDGADKKKIFKAFAEMQSNKTTSRILLNRFIKMIA
jgi:hypothetical protein